MGLTVDNWFSHGFNLFEANDCHRGTSNHEAHIDNEEKVKKFVTQRTLRESPMRNLENNKNKFLATSAFLDMLKKSLSKFWFVRDVMSICSAHSYAREHKSTLDPYACS